MTKAWKAGLFGALALASIAPAAQADDEGAWGPFTAGVSLTSDYRFRGISNSDRDAAIQGWLQYDHAMGFYANIWASTIDFNDEFAHDSSVEVDLTVGYNYAFSDQTNAGIKLVYYWYPDADTPPTLRDYDYFEAIATVGHDFGVASVSGELAWSPDFFAETGDAVSLKAGVSAPVLEKFAFMDGLTASANVGYQWIDSNISAPPGLPGFYGTPDYLYYDFGVSAGWEIFTIDLRWVDTDLDKGECFGGTDLCDGGVTLSLTAALPG
ncbi:MAG: TorF family putative porin [Alphaproteobacteria bacterium]|nr:TorF family putative porin [Alphaproteobacteria bacterium]